jgi:hypothetical protein
MAHGFDAAAFWVDDKRAVVVRMVVRAQPRGRRAIERLLSRPRNPAA